MRFARLLAVLFAGLLVFTSLVGAAAAGPPVEGDGGHRFDIGGDSPHITFWVHLDLFTNLGDAGDFGFSAVGTAMDTKVIVIDIQLQFAGVGPLSEFLSNPFARFSVTADWELNLPFLSTGVNEGDDFSYRDNTTISGDLPPPTLPA
ncbi:DUF7332 family protein [Halobacterium litoreum]|uniref:Uncharacterized protein n=1 Tax=Halobacterium litoreum TaxID=2039234 RepID=A0ABD5NHB3_9EURY|nr:hypothetical protein [Halobacterium litoreum]UHH12649.1 hypothetical protein LT972_10825 [Halobacterium litoreum]